MSVNNNLLLSSVCVSMNLPFTSGDDFFKHFYDLCALLIRNVFNVSSSLDYLL